MERKTKTTHKFYGAWEYDAEESALDSMSQQGWQMDRGACFHQHYVFDPSRRYIYRLDYNPHMKDMDRYKELFTEQGWEYLNTTFNGWTYFRKPYIEGMSAEECEIYTDRDSLNQMQNRFLHMLQAFTIIYSLMALIYFAQGIFSNQVSILLEGIIFILFGTTFGLGWMNIERKRKGMNTLINLPLTVIFPVGIILLIISLFVLF